MGGYTQEYAHPARVKSRCTPSQVQSTSPTKAYKMYNGWGSSMGGTWSAVAGSESPPSTPKSSGGQKRQWTEEEDRIVCEHVRKLGPRKWSKIAANLPGRIGKQCRERWHNHLNPDIRKTPWTPEVDRIILQAHLKYGNQWSYIAKLLPGPGGASTYVPDDDLDSFDSLDASEDLSLSSTPSSPISTPTPRRSESSYGRPVRNKRKAPQSFMTSTPPPAKRERHYSLRLERRASNSSFKTSSKPLALMPEPHPSTVEIKLDED